MKDKQYMNVIIIYKSLPPFAGAVLHDNLDGSYSIIVNSNKSEAKQVESILHELAYINNCDFDSNLTADMIEMLVHNQNNDCDYEGINFYYQFDE